jgi:hypothetical protein
MIDDDQEIEMQGGGPKPRPYEMIEQLHGIYCIHTSIIIYGLNRRNIQSKVSGFLNAPLVLSRGNK